jgi:hypothetical protein
MCIICKYIREYLRGNICFVGGVEIMREKRAEGGYREGKKRVCKEDVGRKRGCREDIGREKESVEREYREGKGEGGRREGVRRI